MNLSFAGCGFLSIYHVGVAVCFKKYAPHLLLNKISGASAGAIAACCLLCDLPLGDMTSDVLRVTTEARSRSLGPFHPRFDIQNILLEGLEKYLPMDAHKIVSGKLHISLTRIHDGKNVLISQFDSRQDLLDALLASAFIPIFSGLWPPKYHGVRYVDGGFSDNLPTLDEHTITVSPFCGESDICPRDDNSAQLFHINVANTSIELSKHNMYRIARVLLPPKPEVLSNMCKQGFDDALRFLHRNNLINCTRCLAVQSTFLVSETYDESVEFDPQCHECNIHRQEALVANMPDTVMTIFQDAIDAANTGLINWIFKFKGMKLLSFLSLPYILPADIMYATLTKFMAATPMMGNKLWELSKLLMDHLGSLLDAVCQLALTECGSNKFDVESCRNTNELNSDQMNLNFTLNLEDNCCDLPLNQSPRRQFTTNKILPKQPSLKINRTDLGGDTFEHILQVTAHHEALMAYYYMDENNKVKVTEIFDVTENDSPLLQSPTERDVNKKLEFDSDWTESWNRNQSFLTERRESTISEYSLEDIERDAAHIFSDPESEWTGTFKIEEPEEGLDDFRPESDQPDRYSIPFKVAPLTYEEF